GQSADEVVNDLAEHRGRYVGRRSVGDGGDRSGPDRRPVRPGRCQVALSPSRPSANGQRTSATPPLFPRLSTGSGAGGSRPYSCPSKRAEVRRQPRTIAWSSSSNPIGRDLFAGFTGPRTGAAGHYGDHVGDQQVVGSSPIAPCRTKRRAAEDQVRMNRAMANRVSRPSKILPVFLSATLMWRQLSKRSSPHARPRSAKVVGARGSEFGRPGGGFGR